MSLRILIVDDEPKSAQLMSAVATPLGHMVLPVADYAAAEQKGQTQRIDAAFVGLRLPEGEGFELAHQIRNSQPNQNAIIVMLSTTNDVPSLRKAYSEGADLVLTKPVSADHLRRMLTAMDLPDWKNRRHSARLPLFTDVKCSWGDKQCTVRSMNISESGMLLHPAIEAALGEEVGLELKIAEVRVVLSLRGRIIRKEGSASVGVEFVGLEPEDINAIQIYVTGRLKEPATREDLLKVEPSRLFRR